MPIDTLPIDLDIIIPVYGQADLLKACLAAVEATCFSINYQLIIVDDKGPDPEQMTAIYATLPPHVKLIRNPENLGFPAAANIGAAAGQAKAILFLNTDVVVQSGAIKQMLDTLFENPYTLPHNPYFDKDFEGGGRPAS